MTQLEDLYKGNPILTEGNFKRARSAANKLGGAIQYGIDGSLILVAEGEVGRDLYPIVKAALDVAQRAKKREARR